MDGVERKSPQKSWLRTSHSVYAAPARPGFLTTYLSTTMAAAAGLERFLAEVPAGELVPGADGYDPIRPDQPVAPALAQGKQVGWVFLNSDFAPSTGYSGKPI